MEECQCQWAIIVTGSSHRMERYIKAFIGFVKWLVLHMVVSPILHRYFEVPVVDLLLEVFRYGGQDGDHPSQGDVESGRDHTDRGA